MIDLPGKVIAIDCETLGLNAMYDAMTSFAAVVFEDGEPTGDHFVRVVAPEFARLKISMEALNVQGKFFGADGNLNREEFIKAIERIFPDDAPGTKQVMTELAQWCQEVGAWGIPNVAHHASFDLGFYDQKLAINTSVYRSALSPVWICTKKLAKMAQLKGSSKFGLQETATLLEIPHDKQLGHEAIYDATLCGRVYFGLRSELARQSLEVVSA